MMFHGGQAGNKYKDFSVNVPEKPLPEQLRFILINELDNLYRYPDILGKSAIEPFANSRGLDPSSIMLGSGATELIYLVSQVLCESGAAILTPTFTEYERALKSQGKRVVNYEVTPTIDHKKTRFEFNNILKDFFNKAKEEKVSAVFICNPNNPTGESLYAQQIIEASEDFKGFVIVDESFVSFTAQPDFVSLEKIKPNIPKNYIIIRSLTKEKSIAGLRAGYLVADKDIITKLEQSKVPWSISSLALAAIKFFAYDKDFVDDRMYQVRDEFIMKLRRLGLKVFFTDANFILFKHQDANKIHKELMRMGYYLRPCNDFIGLDDTYLRVCVKEKKSMDELFIAIREALAIVENEFP